MKVSKLIKGKYQNAQEVKQDSQFKRVILSKNRFKANSSIKNSVFENEGFKTFIPGFRTIKIGVLRGIPVDIKEDELQVAIGLPLKVLKVMRFNRIKQNINVR